MGVDLDCVNQIEKIKIKILWKVNVILNGIITCMNIWDDLYRSILKVYFELLFVISFHVLLKCVLHLILWDVHKDTNNADTSAMTNISHCFMLTLSQKKMIFKTDIVSNDVLK